jgi:hypothetical protein
MQPLAEQPTIDVELMWRATRGLLDGLHGVLERDDAVRRTTCYRGRR